MNGPDGIELAVVSSGDQADSWRRRLEEHLARTGNLAGSPLCSDGLVVVVDDAFPAAMRRAVHHPDACFEAVRDALAAGRRLLPVTVDNAPVPEPDALPEAIRALPRFQGVVLDRPSDLPGVAARLVVAARTASGPSVPARRDGRSVFISYRRDDSWYWASLLARAFAQLVGAGNVFFDIGSIAPGRRFDAEIRARIGGATDFVLLVGPVFLAPGPDGRPRLGDPEDVLRREIAAALEARTRIHVVLTGDGALPEPTRLPQEIAGAFRGAVPRLLTDYHAADPVAGAILAAWEPAGDPSPSRPALSRPRPGAGSLLLRSGLLRHLVRQQEAERFMMSAVPPLAALGWRPVDPVRTGGALMMTRASEEAYRFVFDFESSGLILHERARSWVGMGMKRWIKRAVFPFSADAPDLDILRPPDRQIEAMENPGAYLDRTGRLDLDRAPKPPMPPGTLERALRALAQPARRALDEESRERARIRVRGGLRVLRRLRTVSLGEDVRVRAVAGDPATGRFAAASDHGAWLFDPSGEAVERTRLRGALGLVGFSPDGRLAAADEKHRLSVLDGDGTVMVRRRSPYPAWRRLTGSRGPFRTLSWSADGGRIALGGSDRIWIYEVHDDAFGAVALELDGQGFSAVALFAPGSDDLWIMHFSTLWRASSSTGDIHGRLDIAAGSDVHDAQRPSHSVMEPTVGLRPTCLAVSPDGARLAVGGNDAQLLLVDAERLEPTALRVWHAPMVGGWANGTIEALAFDPGGHRLASVANDGRLVVGDVRTGGAVAYGILSGEGPARPLPVPRESDVRWSADGWRIATVDGYGTVAIWEAPVLPTLSD